VASGNGIVEDAKSSNGSATGRYVAVQLDDGRTTRSLHMSSVSVSTGQRVSKGQALGKSGASGYGSDWYYGAHLHQTLWPGNIWAAPTIDFEKYVGADAPPPSKEDKVKHYHYEDVDAKAGKRLLDPGEGFYLHTKAGQPTSQASNIVGGIGPYSITVHVYAEGEPGDVATVILYWDDTKTSGPNSGHYAADVVIADTGTIATHFEFKRAVAAGYAVYANIHADKANKGVVKVTRFDTDAFMFVSA
jgi:murein DD-endopeptidase MepM/ murein hydrolase activator NlpD